jgi:hypothetical protein
MQIVAVSQFTYRGDAQASKEPEGLRSAISDFRKDTLLNPAASVLASARAMELASRSLIAAQFFREGPRAVIPLSPAHEIACE